MTDKKNMSAPSFLRGHLFVPNVFVFLIMPIETDIPLRPISQSEFGKVAFEVVGHAFDIQKQLGHKFNESVYRAILNHILAQRSKEEVRIRLIHAGFEKSYFMDLVVDFGCPFELKVVPQLHARHRAQLIQYLMLTGLQHGKLINFGGEKVQHEFVNCHESTEHRRSFQVDVDRWSNKSEIARRFHELVVDLLRDWGTGLDRALYDEAITHLLGGGDTVRGQIEILWNGSRIGRQNANLITSDTTFDITCLRQGTETYEDNLHRLLTHTTLKRLYWVNVVSGHVTFTLVPR